MSTSDLATGLSSHPISVAQLLTVGLICNGHDPNKIYDLRTGTLKDLGMAAPTAAPTPSDNGAGNVNGTVKYRVRWYDSSTFTLSLPGPSVEHSTALKKIQVIAPGSPPSRATHWIIERTKNGRGVFFPINRTTSTPNGTAIATTTYNDDNDSDDTIGARTSLPENQGQPDRPFKICFANNVVLHMLGSRVHQPNASCANGSANVSSPDGDFTQDMIGEDFRFTADTDGKTYAIATVSDADNLVLSENYAGATKTNQPATITGQGDLAAWCEPGEPESWGKSVVGGLSNTVRVGQDGEPLTAGIGLGLAGALYCKARSMYIHAYRLNPKFKGVGSGDGQIISMQTNRGAAGRNCLYVADGAVYGMDVYGIWRMAIGSKPVDISPEIQEDWKALNFNQGDNFHIRYDAEYQWLMFFVVESGDTYAKNAFVWDLSSSQWVCKYPTAWGGITAGLELPDLNGRMRPCVWSEKVGGANAYPWFLNIGNSWGAPPSTTPLVATVSSGSSTTASLSGATLPTDGDGLDGIPMTLVRADGTEETSVITANTTTQITFNSLSGDAPVSGDTIILGPIPAKWLTGRIYGATPAEAKVKKKWKRAYIWLEENSSAIDIICRVYYDGSSTAYAERLARDEDGVATTASSAKVTISASDQKGRYYIDLGGKWAQDIQLEFYSLQSGQAWKILDLGLEYDVDRSGDPRKKG